MTTRIKRSGGIRMKISPDIEERLATISALYGMPPSTLAALALGQWISHQERSLHLATAIADSVGAQMGDAVAAELRQQLSLMTLEPDQET